MRRIKVALVSQSMNVGGGEMMAAKLSGYINQELFDVKLFIVGMYQDNQIAKILKHNHVNYECLNLPHSFHISSYKTFSKALKDFNPDVVHAHLDYAYSWVWTILHNKPLIFTQHSDPFRRKSKRIALVIKLKSLQKNLMVIGCSKITVSLVKKCYGLKDIHTGCIYNPIDISEFTPNIGGSGTVSKFVAIGRLHDVKNYPLMINAFKNVIEKGKEVELNIAGIGPLESELKAMASALGISDKIHFLGNIDQIHKLLPKMDVLLLSSVSEACPMVILEAMASGLPVISTDVGGVPELIHDNGLLVKSGDIEAFANAMIRLIDSPELAKEISERALSNVQKYDKSVIVRQYEKEYANMAKRNI